MHEIFHLFLSLHEIFHGPPIKAESVLTLQGVNVKHVSREFGVSCILKGMGTRDSAKQVCLDP